MAKIDTRRHHWVVRLTHWVNAVALTVMIGSGLRIFNAYPAFARRGETFCCYPFEGSPIPEWLTFGGWLAGARNWHFAMMWVLVLNGLVYIGFLWLHGEWRDLVPRRGDWRDALRMMRFYLYRLAKHPAQGKHNALQKQAYTFIVILGVLSVLTGFALWKPVQFPWLTAAFGGFQSARYWHFIAVWLFVGFTIVHIALVLIVDPATLRAMVTGWGAGARGTGNGEHGTGEQDNRNRTLGTGHTNPATGISEP